MAETKTHVPAPAIFQSDPTEQIFARGMLDRDMSGLSFMFKNAAGMQRDADQETYMQGVQQANKMAMALSGQEDMMKLLQESLKQGPEYAKAGLPLERIPLIARLITGGGTDQQTRDSSGLVNELKKAMIAKDYAEAANAGGDKTEVTDVYGPGGYAGSQIKGSSKGSGTALIDAMTARAAQLRATQDKGGMRAPTPVNMNTYRDVTALMGGGNRGW